jgi:hypothetical protein
MERGIREKNVFYTTKEIEIIQVNESVYFPLGHLGCNGLISKFTEILNKRFIMLRKCDIIQTIQINIFHHIPH